MLEINTRVLITIDHFNKCILIIILILYNTKNLYKSRCLYPAALNSNRLIIKIILVDSNRYFDIYTYRLH